MRIYRRKISVHEVHKRGEETYRKKSGLEETILDFPKPPEQAAQPKNIGIVFLLLSQLIAMNFEWLKLLQNLVAITSVLCR